MAKMSFDPNEVVRMERRTLTLHRLMATTVIGRTTQETARLTTYEDIGVEGLVMQLQADVLSDKITDDTYVAGYQYEEYVGLWDHIKDRLAPSWFKRRYPVQWRTVRNTVEVKFTRLATYPKANVAIQKDRPFFVDVLGGHETLRDIVEQVR